MVFASPLSYFAKEGTTSLTVLKARHAQKGQECWPYIKRILLFAAAELTLLPNSIIDYVHLTSMHCMRELWVEDFRHCITQLSDVFGDGRDVSSGSTESLPQLVVLYITAWAVCFMT